MAASIGAARIELSINSAKFDAQMKRAAASVGKFEASLRSTRRKFKKTGRKMQRIGSSLQRTVTLPLLAVGGASIKAASDFNSSMTRIQTLVGLSRKQVQGMQADVLALAKEAGRGPKELSDALFTVTSAGLRGAKAMNVLERAAKASAIGLGDTKDIARALTGVLQSYQKQGLSAAEATDTLVGIVREGNLQAAELAPVLGRVTGIASQLGISFQEVGASIATFTRLGVSSEEAVTGLRGIMNALLKQTPKARKALASVGSTFGDLRKEITQKGLARALVDLVGKFKGNEQGLSALLGRVRGLAAVLGTAGAQSKNYIKIADKLRNSTGLLDKGFEEVSKTARQKFNKVLANLKVTAIKLGNALLPLATKLLGAVNSLITGFNNLGPAGQALATAFAAIGVVLPALLTSLGFLSATVIPALITGFEVLAAASGPIYLTVAALAAIGLGVAHFATKTDDATKAQNKFIDAVESGNKSLREAGRKIEGLSTKEQFYATQSLLGKKKQEFSKIKKLYNNIESLSSKQLIAAGGRPEIKNRYKALKKELGALEDRKKKLRALNDAEVKLHMLQKRFANFDEATQKKYTKRARDKVTSLQKQLGLYHDIETHAKKTNNATSGGSPSVGGQQSVPVTIQPNFSLAPFGALRNKFKTVWADLQKQLQAITTKSKLPDIFPNFKATAARVAAMKDTLNTLIDKGLAPSSKAVKQLRDAINELNGTNLDLDTSGLKNFKQVAGDTRSSLDIALGGIQGKSTSFLKKFKADFLEAGQSFNNFIANQLSSSIASFAESVGTSLAGVGNEFQTGLEKVIILVANFAKKLGTILIGIGTAIAFLPGFQGPAGLYIAAGAALVAIASGVSAGINKRASNRQSRAENTSPAGMAAGGVVPSGFPNDSYPAMLTSGETVIPKPHPLPATSGGGSTDINLSGQFRIKGTDLVIALERAQKRYR